jgi:predicted restriction endonuclease
MPRGKDTFFSFLQRQEHSADVGHQCEFFIDKGVRCPENGYLEADHVQPVHKGGETELDNMLWLCLFHHALKHRLDEEHQIARMIQKRAHEQ